MVVTPPQAPDWDSIETVMLDMDGTLLDLQFDNYFWRHLIPQHYGNANNLTQAEAWARLSQHYENQKGTLNWYCLDYWAEALELDVVALKNDVADGICLLPGVVEFLEQLSGSGSKVMLVTNAHQDSLDLKLARTGIADRFDRIISSHSLGWPKEHGQFWRTLSEIEGFDPAKTLFVDDSLPVLDAARDFGIAWLCAICQPDSSVAPAPVQDYYSVIGVAQLIRSANV